MRIVPYCRIFFPKGVHLVWNFQKMLPQLFTLENFFLICINLPKFEFSKMNSIRNVRTVGQNELDISWSIFNLIVSDVRATTNCRPVKVFPRRLRTVIWISGENAKFIGNEESFVLCFADWAYLLRRGRCSRSIWTVMWHTKELEES